MTYSFLELAAPLFVLVPTLVYFAIGLYAGYKRTKTGKDGVVLVAFPVTWIPLYFSLAFALSGCIFFSAFDVQNAWEGPALFFFPALLCLTVLITARANRKREELQKAGQYPAVKPER